MVSPFGGSSTAFKFLVGHLNKGIHSFIHSFVNIKCTNESHREWQNLPHMQIKLPAEL